MSTRFVDCRRKRSSGLFQEYPIVLVSAFGDVEPVVRVDAVSSASNLVIVGSASASWPFAAASSSTLTWRTPLADVYEKRPVRAAGERSVRSRLSSDD